jgi:small GTP-binding protein
MSTPEQIVDERLRPLIEAEKEALAALRELAIAGEHGEDARRLGEILAGIDELFLLVVVGEFNSGKSSFINALFGEKTRVEGPVPVDDRVTIMHYGEEPSERAISAFVVEKRAPVEFLRDIAIVDTPGTNSVVRQHQEITEDFIPRADLVLFLTSIDRPLTESERQFLTYIRKWGKKVVFVVNKIDTKEPEEVDEVLGFVDEKVRELFGIRPMIFPISSRLAFAAKQGANPREWTRSRFEPLEDYIFRTLAEGEKVRLKLLSPLDSAATVAETLSDEHEARRRLLAEDAHKIARIEEQLEAARREMRINFERFTLRVDGLVVELRDRGVDFLDRAVRLNHLKLLRSETLFREAFEREVLAEWQEDLGRAVEESVDWLVRNNMKLWNDTLDYFNAQVRKSDVEAKVLGRVGGQFVYEREEVRTRLRRDADARIRSLDHREECRRVIDSAISGLQQSVGLGASAVGLGYVLATAFTSVALDVTGIAAAAVLFAASFFVLPYKRRRAIDQFRAKTERLRLDLRGALTVASNREIDAAVDNVRTALEPYTRYVGAEHATVERRAGELAHLRERLAILRRDIESVVGPSPEQRRRAS